MALLDLFSGRRASRAGRPKRSRKLTSESLQIKRERMAIQHLAKCWGDADPPTRMQMTAQMLEIRLAPIKEKTPKQQIDEALRDSPEYIDSRVQAMIRENKAQFANASQSLAAKINQLALEQIEERSRGTQPSPRSGR